MNVECPKCKCKFEAVDDGSQPSALEIDAKLNPGEYPFGVDVSPARRAYLNRMLPGDGPD